MTSTIAQATVALERIQSILDTKPLILYSKGKEPGKLNAILFLNRSFFLIMRNPLF
ncbi:MAG: hypothetical protein WDM78_22935 [Puia sp.]